MWPELPVMRNDGPVEAHLSNRNAALMIFIFHACFFFFLNENQPFYTLHTIDVAITVVSHGRFQVKSQ